MNEPARTQSPRTTRKRRRAVGITLAVAGVALGTWWTLRSPAIPVQPVLGLNDLVRRDGRLILRSATNQPFTGWLVEQHPDGTLKSRSQVVRGVLNGVSEGWHTNGQMQVREHFTEGVANGVRVKWHANGATQSVATIAQGKVQGRFLRWFEDGTLSEDVPMQDGQPEGVSRAFYPSGFVKAEVRLKAGQIVEQRFWNDGEVPASSGQSAAATREARKGS